MIHYQHRKCRLKHNLTWATCAVNKWINESSGFTFAPARSSEVCVCQCVCVCLCVSYSIGLVVRLSQEIDMTGQ